MRACVFFSILPPLFMIWFGYRCSVKKGLSESFGLKIVCCFIRVIFRRSIDSTLHCVHEQDWFTNIITQANMYVVKICEADKSQRTIKMLLLRNALWRIWKRCKQMHAVHLAWCESIATQPKKKVKIGKAWAIIVGRKILKFPKHYRKTANSTNMNDIYNAYRHVYDGNGCVPIIRFGKTEHWRKKRVIVVITTIQSTHMRRQEVPQNIINECANRTW